MMLEHATLDKLFCLITTILYMCNCSDLEICNLYLEICNLYFYFKKPSKKWTRYTAAVIAVCHKNIVVWKILELHIQLLKNMGKHLE